MSGISACPTCQRPWSAEATSKPSLTSRELDALSAWWHTNSVQQAAVLIGVTEQRAKNLLANARVRSGASSNGELVSLYLGQIRTMATLIASHNARRGEAA